MSITAEVLSKRFRGCLVGTLLGDCFGGPFEFERRSSVRIINKYFRKHHDPNLRVPFKAYTDDTAMTRCVARSLINNKSYNDVDMAKQFVKEYYAEPHRGYGKGIVDVFAALRAIDFKDPYSPAKLQFGGSGSFGNGGGMRTAPVALFGYNKSTEEVSNMAKSIAMLTHANRLGYNGAILQCLAIHHAIKTPEKSLDSIKYVEQLIKDMEVIEPPQEDEITDGKVTLIYVEKLKYILELLQKDDEVPNDMIIDKLGNDVTAPGSIPTAIYSFLKAIYPIKGIETDNSFERTLIYAIGLGGDTDTIASMAGGIAGAYYGYDEIPYTLQKHCETVDVTLEQSDNLFALVFK